MRIQSLFIFLACALGVAIAGALWWHVHTRAVLPLPSQQIATSTITTLAEPATVAPTQSTNYVPRTPSAGFAEYHKEAYHLSFFYPSGWVYKEIIKGQDNPLLLVFQNPMDPTEGFQMYIFPYDQPTITDERFKLDEPSGVKQNVFNVAVDGAQGIMFISTDPVVGNLREIWFIHEGLLYEVTTALAHDDQIKSIMQTWQFVP